MPKVDDDIMMQRMVHIVISENRPFCYKDFLDFEIGKNRYGMAHGTFRNRISKWKSIDEVKVSYYSHCAYYTLKDHKFGKKMTPNRVVVSNNPIYHMLANLPLDKQCIHDVRLRFKVRNLWNLVSDIGGFAINRISKDIMIPTWIQENTLIRISVHKTDTVSVILGCSLKPIPLDHDGIVRFCTSLVRIEDKLKSIIENSLSSYKKDIIIPEYRKWIITMWHFGRDALQDYRGERYSITLEDAHHILRRIYVKDFNGKQKIRVERQEYPSIKVEEIVDTILR